MSASKKPEESFVETNHLVLPSHANALETIFGGVIMSWIDIIAAISAQRHSGCVCVTASVDRLHFLSPVLVGDAVTLKAHVVHTGRTSMTIKVIVVAKALTENSPRECVRSYLTFIALDDKRKPTAVPALDVVTPEDKKEFHKAAERRKVLLQEKQQS